MFSLNVVVNHHHYHYYYVVLEILLLIITVWQKRAKMGQLLSLRPRTSQTLIVDIQQFTQSDSQLTLDRRRVYLSDSHEVASDCN